MRIFVKLAALATLFASAAVAAPVPKDKTPLVAEVLAEAEKAAAEIEDRDARAFTLSQIAREYGCSGDTKAARRVFAEAADFYRAAKGVSIVTLPAMMIKVGLIDEGLELLEKVAADYPGYVGVQRIDCLCGLRGSRKVKQQAELYDALSPDDREPVASVMATGYAEAGDFKAAEEVLDGLRTPWARVEVRLELAMVYHRAKDAKKTADHLKAATEVVENEIREADAFWRLKLPIAQAGTGDRKAAHATLEKLAPSARYLETVLAVVDADLATGDVKAATEAAKLCEDAADTDQALLRVVDYHLSKGDTEKAAKVIDGMKRPFWEARSRLRLAVALAQAEKKDESAKQVAAAEKLVGRNGDKLPRVIGFDGPMEFPETVMEEFVRTGVALGEVRARMDEYAKTKEPSERASRLLTLAKGFRPPTREERGW